MANKYPDALGNGPSGYPMNNPAFDAAVKRVLHKRKADLEKAEKFLELLDQKLREANNKVSK